MKAIENFTAQIIWAPATKEEVRGLLFRLIKQAVGRYGTKTLANKRP
jgi:hypothetical protein